MLCDCYLVCSASPDDALEAVKTGSFKYDDTDLYVGENICHIFCVLNYLGLASELAVGKDADTTTTVKAQGSWDRSTEDNSGTKKAASKT